MDITSLGITGVAAITIVCYLIGEVVKSTGLNNKWIPAICGVCGLVFGVASMRFMPDFPANDYITAAAIGVVSGLAATGANQTVKQLTNK